MRSARPSSCSSHRRGPTHGFLPAVAGIIDQTTLDEPGHVLVHVDGPVHPDVCLGLQEHRPRRAPLRGARRLHRPRLVDGLRDPSTRAGRTTSTTRTRRRSARRSPSSWTATATRHPCCAWARRSANRAGPAVGHDPRPVARRVLGVATSACTHVHGTPLDRDVARPGAGALVPTRSAAAISTSSWGQIAVLHPAVHAPVAPDVVAFADPASLVSVAALARGGHLLGRAAALAVAAGAARRPARTGRRAVDGRRLLRPVDDRSLPLHRHDGHRPARAARRRARASAARDDGGGAQVTVGPVSPAPPRHGGRRSARRRSRGPRAGRPRCARRPSAPWSAAGAPRPGP